MVQSFKFSSLLKLRKEDVFFSLLKKDKLFELFVSFLHEAYDEKENRELSQETFLGMFSRFMARESDIAAEAGMLGMEAENALNLMMSEGYNLISRRIIWDANGKEASFVLVTTDTYADVARLIEERSRYTSAGSSLEIKDTIEAVKSVADILSGDAEKQKEALKEKISALRKELSELERTGKAKPVDAGEVRQQVSYIRKRIGNITAFLSRGTAEFKEECSAHWEAVSGDVKDAGKQSGGAVAAKVLQGLGSFLRSDVFKSYEASLELLVSPDEQQALSDNLERILANPEARKVLNEEDINMRALLRKVLRDSAACHEIIHKEISRLNAYMRSGEVERNRLLYQKADNILLAWKNEGDKVPFRRYIFSFRGCKPDVVSPVRRTPAMPKKKPRLVHASVAPGLLPGNSNAVVFYRDIRSAGIAQKFRRLLDRHGGSFGLDDYVSEENTSLGLYEFLAARVIMVRYMGKDMVSECLAMPKKKFNVTDFAPKGGSGYKEICVLSHVYRFDERAYNLWEKDRFAI